MESLRTFVTSQQLQHDVNVFSKYLCECPWIYDLFGLPRNNTPYKHFTNDSRFEYDDLYKHVVYYGTEHPVPEVIYHNAPNESPSDIIIDAPKDKDLDDDRLTEHNHYADEFTLPPLALVHVDLTDTDTDGSVVSQQSQQSHDSIDIIVPDRDLPDKDEWDIL